MAAASPSTGVARSGARAGGARWLGIAGALGALVLGLVLLVAAALKTLDPVAFAEEIARQRVGFGLSPRLAALAALAVEAGLGVALVLNLRRRIVLVFATLLVAFFLFLTGRAAWRESQGIVDDSGSCGCFGALVDRSPAEAFVQDLVLMVPALALAWVALPGARRGVALRWTLAFAAAGATAFAATRTPSLPLDDWATRLKPGVEISGLCAGRAEKRICLANLVPELASGSHLVVVADLSDPGFDALARRLNAYAKSGAQPPLTVLADFTLEQRQALFWRVAPAFALHEAPKALLRPLYRRVPRSFRVESGRVTETWPGLPASIPAAPEAK